MTYPERDVMRTELAMLEEMLRLIDESRVIERAGIEARRDRVREELRNACEEQDRGKEVSPLENSPDVGAQEIAASMQFLLDSQGQVTSVLLSAVAWKHLVKQLENAEDRALLMQLAPKLAAGPAGALRWRE